MMTRFTLIIMICISLAGGMSSVARADLKYFPDPAYKRLNADDPPPMSEMTDLANEGDVRAMFILGDMYEKGKPREAAHEKCEYGDNSKTLRARECAQHYAVRRQPLNSGAPAVLQSPRRPV